MCSAPIPGLGTLVQSSEDQIDASYSYLNYSTAVEYRFSNKTSSFIRFSQGHKAPELDYYINNFTNQDFPPENPPSQSIQQLELGLRHKTKNLSFTGTFFLSNLSDVAFSNFVFDDIESVIFFTPTQFNSSRTIGLELESAAALSEYIALDFSATIQDPMLTEFTLFDANQTIDISDDQTIDFSDNTIPHNPNFMANVGLTYDRDDWFSGIRYNFIGSRFGNIENAFTLPSYGTVDLDVGYALTSNFSLGLRVKNLLNSGGLANFFGPNIFGSNSDAATAEFIQANPNESFVVFPISPRAIYFSVDYRFSK